MFRVLMYVVCDSVRGGYDSRDFDIRLRSIHQRGDAHALAHPLEETPCLQLRISEDDDDSKKTRTAQLIVETRIRNRNDATCDSSLRYLPLHTAVACH